MIVTTFQPLWTARTAVGIRYYIPENVFVQWRFSFLYPIIRYHSLCLNTE